MIEPVLRLNQISKRFGGFTALSEVTLDVARGERLGLIGPNGSGKTTLINCVSGVLRPDRGQVVLEGRDVSSLPPYRRARAGLARSFQLPNPFSSMTVLENLMVPLEYVVHGLLNVAGRSHVQVEAMEILRGVRLADKAHVQAGRLTQVELRKLELARAICARPRLLISDEAMAGLATQEVTEILDILFKLNQSGIAIVMIEHIMHAVMHFSQRVVCLNAGKVICEGKPQDVFENVDVRRAYLGA